VFDEVLGQLPAEAVEIAGTDSVVESPYRGGPIVGINGSPRATEDPLSDHRLRFSPLDKPRSLAVLEAGT